VKSEVYLAGPYVAAASAIAGHICGPEQLLEPAHA
jgi:homoaconitase/3-isopropylmalate dehydratase large subunit